MSDHVGEALVIGYRPEEEQPRNIGLAVTRQLGEIGLNLRGVVRTSGLWVPDGEGELIAAEDPEGWKQLDVDFVFLTIPSSRGDDAVEYMRHFAGDNDRSTVVITAEKGALADHFDEVFPWIKSGRVLATASLGGGTRMLPYLESNLSDRVTGVNAVVNGTVNFVMTNLGEDANWVAAVDQAIHDGYADPFEEEPETEIEKVLTVMNGEVVGDIPKKTANLWNLAFSEMVGETVHWEDLQSEELTKADIGHLAAHHRFVVSIYRSGSSFTPEYVLESGSFEKAVDGWIISGGFIDINKLKRLDLPNQFNGLMVVKKSGKNGDNTVVGEGAGPGPTSESMLQDAERSMRGKAA